MLGLDPIQTSGDECTWRVTAVYLLAEVIICSHDSPETLNLLLCIRVTAGRGPRGIVVWRVCKVENGERLVVEAGASGGETVENLEICPAVWRSAALKSRDAVRV